MPSNLSRTAKSPTNFQTILLNHGRFERSTSYESASISIRAFWWRQFHLFARDDEIVNDANKWIYSKSDNNGSVIICLYVDDMLIFGSNISCVNETKKFLSSKFDMKDLGEADVILGI